MFRIVLLCKVAKKKSQGPVFKQLAITIYGQDRLICNRLNIHFSILLLKVEILCSSTKKSLSSQKKK